MRPGLSPEHRHSQRHEGPDSKNPADTQLGGDLPPAGGSREEEQVRSSAYEFSIEQRRSDARCRDRYVSNAPRTGGAGGLHCAANGFRMIDTANAYMNERAVGRGMRRFGVPREDIFLSTKIWASEYEKENAVEKTPEIPGVDYIDLLYIHQPSGNYMVGYRLLERAYKEGRIRAIGISDFHDEKLERLLAECKIKPHVIQLEEHPYFSDAKTLDMLAPYGVRLMSWYPLGHGDKGLLEEPVFTEPAAKYGKTPAQIILRWHVQNDTAIIPGFTNPKHIRENADPFDIALSPEEMARINGLSKNTRYYNPAPGTEEKYASFAIDLESQP